MLSIATISKVALTSLAASASAAIIYAGINESGGEFGGSNIPGTFGSDYAFINQDTASQFRNDGANLFRISFLMERMSPGTLGGTFDETHYGHYADAVNYVTNTLGAYCILDPHNYMRYGDPSMQPNSGAIIGSGDAGAATTDQFQAFWQELAGRFAGNEKVIFGINNEPHDMATSLILANNQAAINGIRAAGADQLILAPGNGYTGGHSWTQGSDPSSALLYQFSDPMSNTAIDIHEYLDTDFSGQHSACVNPGPSNLADLTSWLQQHNLKALISETGGSNNADCANELGELYDYLASNDVYIGWAAWAAGPLWGSNPACCNDGNQVGSLEPGTTPSQYDDVWVAEIKPHIPAGLKSGGISSLS